MADFEMKCPHCGSALVAQDEWVGLDVECPSCGKTFRVEPKVPVMTPAVAPIPVLNKPQVPPAPGFTPPPAGGAVPPPVAPQMMPANNGGVSQRTRTAYILLGIFLGGLGIHDFYAGYKARGFVKLGAALFTCLCCPVLGTATGLWALVDICTIKVDVDEKPFA